MVFQSVHLKRIAGIMFSSRRPASGCQVYGVGFWIKELLCVRVCALCFVFGVLLFCADRGSRRGRRRRACLLSSSRVQRFRVRGLGCGIKSIGVQGSDSRMWGVRISQRRV